MYYLFLTFYYMFRTHNFAKNNYRSLISLLSLATVFFDLALWRHPNWSVTSRERGVLVLLTAYSSIVLTRSNWRKGDLHWWKTTANIDFSPPGIHGLACTKFLALIHRLCRGVMILGMFIEMIPMCILKATWYINRSHWKLARKTYEWVVYE